MTLREILGLEFPFIQGGMANIATGEFAAAASNAGGLGIIGSGGMNAEMLEEHIKRAKSLTDKPFGVNLMLMNPECDKMAELLVREGVPVVTTGAGSPSKYMEMWKAAGIKVAPVVSGAALARRLEQAGADLLIAEGCESGGHIGELTTMALVPQVVDAVQLPVVAAGGIADSRQLLAAFALGAVGAQLGTCLLVSEECPIHANYKEAVLKARDNSTTVTGRIAGAPVRILKNAMTRDYLKLEKSGAELLELEKFTLGGLRRAVFDGDVQRGSLMAGQVAGLLKEIKPLRQIFEELMAGLPAVAQGLTDKKII
ncbi:MAG: enoyl-[acyl-carrier-protein] reductase FabK [Peptococcaceae bacterium]|jgi:enoyl-[acyl-carrier protein] reductase II|nr:enoyl-[acyl-carrier-protein] reductase FabK [Peptococcaceae bacterium]